MEPLARALAPAADGESSTEATETDEGEEWWLAFILPVRQRMQRLVFIIALLVVHVVVSAHASFLAHGLLQDYGWAPCNHDLLISAITNFCAALFALTVLAVLLYLRGAEKPAMFVQHLEQVIAAVWLKLLIKVPYCVMAAGSCCVIGEASLADDGPTGLDEAEIIGLDRYRGATLLHFAVEIIRKVVFFLYVRALEKRLSLIEAAFGEALGSRRIRAVRSAYMVIGVCLVFMQAFPRLAGRPWRRSGHLGEYAAQGLTDVWDIGLCAALFVFVWRATACLLPKPSQASMLPDGYAQAEANWSLRVLTNLRWSMLLPLFTDGVLHCCVLLVETSPSYHTVTCIKSAVVMCTEFACISWMLGMFQERRPDFRLPPGSAHPHLLSPKAETRNSAWAAKVHDLAGRSVDVAALLALHARLGGADVMPHYDPWRSTTNDVVRQAIIPLSRVEDRGVAYSTLLGENVPPAQRMVTHTWSGLFVDLVAAVMADALDLKEYSAVSEALANKRHSALRRDLEVAGSLHRTYWICALCVNQHANICGGFAHEPPLEDSRAHAMWERGRRDSVTNEVFPCCDCEEPKAFNDQPDGCELNKFDEMMAVLHHDVPGFCHLVVVDRDFRVFSRIWCVAELVQASFSGIPQNVQLSSGEGLRDDAEDLDLYFRLSSMTVRDAEATRAEDRDAILARIPCVTEFDLHLQAAIFGEHGLLSRRLRGFDWVEAAASTARRVKAFARSRSSSRKEFLAESEDNEDETTVPLNCGLGAER